MSHGTQENLGRGDGVLDGVPAPPYKGHSPQFSAHVYCGQTAGWMKTPLGTEVEHIVLDGDSAPPPRKGHNSPPLLAHVYCGHGRPSQLLLSSCTTEGSKNIRVLLAFHCNYVPILHRF